MDKTEFATTIYIRTTPQAVWNAFTDTDICARFWVDGITSDWQPGSQWRRHSTDGTRVSVCGEVQVSDPPRRLAMTWADPKDVGNVENHSLTTIDIEAIGDMVRVSLVHSNLEASSEVARKISIGWPRVLSSVKSLLETGQPLDTWAGYTF